MKFKNLLLCSAFLIFASCGSKEKASESDTPVAATTPIEPTLPALESADASFVVKGKEIGKLTLVDTGSGMTTTFSAEKLEKGTYVIQFEEACLTAPRLKNELPPKITKIIVGEFSTGSGNTSSEFTKSGMSIGERFMPVAEKAITLSKKAKSGKLTRLACSTIVKR